MADDVVKPDDAFWHRERTCEAGVLALWPTGWTLADRTKFNDMQSAYRWLKRRIGTLGRRLPDIQHRGTVIDLTGFLTLEKVLAEYEAKRKAGQKIDEF